MKPAAAALVLLLGLQSPFAPARAAPEPAEEPEVTLPACGIRYPGGYDPNTVGVVDGRVSSFALPRQGPVSFRLEAAAEAYIVLVAPAWYWEELRTKLADGDQVRVRGSKTMGADGNLYLIAQELAVAGGAQPVVLRDTGGKPLWSGCGPGGCGKRRR